MACGLKSTYFYKNDPFKPKFPLNWTLDLVLKDLTLERGFTVQLKCPCFPLDRFQIYNLPNTDLTSMSDLSFETLVRKA